MTRLDTWNLNFSERCSDKFGGKYECHVGSQIPISKDVLGGANSATEISNVVIQLHQIGHVSLIEVAQINGD